ncbi:DNA polymerase kappa [Monodelphis domestica]|uniref:DNA polymerase kappa n=1 Tax=Monodelphis domestica TaxID=13616 RepID=UPI0024E1D077|nr:DNA polymerase kappa [Monodelphis domestica]XP_007486612.2 DNA polymerase kappa [Monodelphis domestica]XP_007486613.2 DNA polymerase kappa [Monodelphis domestica]XP_007486614.2 DNA polymerase kappa [Monodelphis domestica]XP_056680737.1 DNA polymerase kappa [Monodelphis domestica]
MDNDGLLLRMGLNDNKAGMEGLDKEKINKIIMEASKGSRFYENELKKEKQVNQRIENMMQQKSQITTKQLWKAQLQVDKFAMELEQSRDLHCTIIHIDMDAFYAAVEMRDNPELRDKPIAVGSMRMLATSNYHARRFGVRAAMPGFIAKRLCPQLTIVAPNFDKYKKISKEVREILADYDPNFMAMSLDEAYLNITKHLEERQNWPEDKRRHFIKTGNPSENDKTEAVGSRAPELNEDTLSVSPLLFEDSPPQLKKPEPEIPSQEHFEEQRDPQGLQNSVIFGTSAEEVVKEIRFRIKQKTSLTASAGIAPNTVLAKVCSDKNKPNGQYQIPPTRQAVMDFIKDLPIRKVPGIGKVTEKMLKALGIITCSDLYQKRALLSLLFSETSWHSFLHISLGLGSTQMERDGERKSRSIERTFTEISKAEELYSLCQELCSDLAQDLQREGLKGKTVTIKLKNVNFEVKTRASTVAAVVSTAEEIFAIAKELLKAEIDADYPQPLRLRLMGVRISGFANEEDPKNRQRSIISFLKAGGHSLDTVGSVLEKNDRDRVVKPPEASHKESFFTKKRSEMSWNHQVIFKCEPEAKQDFQVSQPPSLSKEEMNENLATSENVDECQVFTCPICFMEQGKICLEALNRHVDECLSRTLIDCDPKMVAVPQSQSLCSEVNPDLKPQKTIESPLVDFVPSVSVDVLSKGHHTAALSTVAGNEKNQKQYSSLWNNSCLDEYFYQNPSHENEGSDATSSGEPKALQTNLSQDKYTLVCPVCNLEQKTSDLMLFNGHVDICLNKGLIKELREDNVNLVMNCSTESSKNTTESSGKMQRPGNNMAKMKRPGLMTNNSTSKKTKPNNSKYTIDTFFK